MNSRREFIYGGMAVGGVLATAGLSSHADNPSLFAKRGKFERLALSYGHVEIGLERPFSVLHVSDTHLTDVFDHENERKRKLASSRRETFGGRQEEALRDTLAWAKANVDYVVHTGDIIDFQSEANYAHVRRYLGSGCVVGTVGNHEFSPEMYYSKIRESPTESYKDLTRAELQDAYPFDISFGSTVVNGVNFVAMDNVYGTVTDCQVARFETEVKRGLPIVLCLHVPLVTDDIWRYWNRFWKQDGRRFSSVALPPPSGDYQRQQEDATTRSFIGRLRGEKMLRAILAGHLHINAESRFSPSAIQYLTGGNFEFQAREMLFT